MDSQIEIVVKVTPMWIANCWFAAITLAIVVPYAVRHWRETVDIIFAGRR
jgi:hypothetical protein